MGVSYKGTVKNGVVVLPPEARLAEGSTVEVTPLQEAAEDPPFLQAILKLAKGVSINNVYNSLSACGRMM